MRTLRGAWCMCVLTLLLMANLVLPGDVCAGLAQVDKVLVVKSKRVLVLMSEGEILRTYKIALGGRPVGHKLQKGDQRTPEGTYILDFRNPHSKYHLSIHISYPNHLDRENAQRRGAEPGGDIMIHGLPEDLGNVGKLHRAVDWTKGCIAVTNKEMEEIWRLVPDGTPIEIKP